MKSVLQMYNSKKTILQMYNLVKLPYLTIPVYLQNLPIKKIKYLTMAGVFEFLYEEHKTFLNF